MNSCLLYIAIQPVGSWCCGKHSHNCGLQVLSQLPVYAWNGAIGI